MDFLNTRVPFQDAMVIAILIGIALSIPIITFYLGRISGSLQQALAVLGQIRDELRRHGR